VQKNRFEIAILEKGGNRSINERDVTKNYLEEKLEMW
jgi:hypothetical protein